MAQPRRRRQVGRLRAGAGASDQAAATCSVAGKTSASLAFALGKGAPVEIVTAVRTSRDPSCVARPTTTTDSKLCGLGEDATAAGAKILADAKTVTLAVAQRDHRESWQAFWNVSTISLPDAPETEAFWCTSPREPLKCWSPASLPDTAVSRCCLRGQTARSTS